MKSMAKHSQDGTDSNYHCWQFNFAQALSLNSRHSSFVFNARQNTKSSSTFEWIKPLSTILLTYISLLTRIPLFIVNAIWASSKAVYSIYTYMTSKTSPWLCSNEVGSLQKEDIMRWWYSSLVGKSRERKLFVESSNRRISNGVSIIRWQRNGGTREADG